MNVKENPADVRDIYMRFRVNVKEKLEIEKKAKASKYKTTGEYMREKALEK